MKDKWLKDLHDRMSEFEMDSPDNLWDEIEEIELRRQRESSSTILSPGKRWMAVAAVVAVVLSMAYYTWTFMPDLSQVAETGFRYCDTSSFPAEVEVDGEIDINSKGGYVDDARRVMASVRPADLPVVEETSSDAGEDVSGVIEDIEEDDTVDNVNEVKNEKSPEVTYPSVRTGRTHNIIAFTAQSDGGNNRVSVGVYSSGGMGANVMRNSLGTGPVAAGADNVRWEGRPALGILLCNQGREITTDIKHRQPVRTGVSFTYKLTDRLGIGSGVSYTYLASDLKSGSDTHYFTGEQSLHYVGVPLTVTYNIIRWKRLQLYASGGALLEKCVAGKVNSGYVLDNNVTETESGDIEDKPLQFSVNASAGVQLDFTSAIGIYAEPGVSYYFKDGSEINNIYKEKPLNLNVNVGLRFTFGK
ncbi:MAG: PorT family protein [Paenibacillus sp.]|nr:PorT family protein [Paenibacillus sp.]